MTIRGETYIRSHSLLGIPEFIEQLGGNPKKMLSEVGLPLGGFDENHRVVSHRAVAVLMDKAADKFNRPCFALDLLDQMPKHYPAVGPIMMLARFEKTVRAWMYAAQKYVKFHSNAFFVEVHEKPNSPTFTMRYVCDPLSAFSRHYAESTLGVIAAMLRAATARPDENPVVVRFQHSCPTDDLSPYDKAFGCPVEFDADYNEILFKTEVLDYSTQGNLSFLKSILGLYVNQRMARMPMYQSSASTLVSLAISSALSSGHCNIEKIALSLDINVKKLQRQLQEEGTSFSALLERVRESTAKSLLVTSNIPISRIAGLLDYAGTPPFTLAFRRWTDMSPQEFRKRKTKLN